MCTRTPGWSVAALLLAIPIAAWGDISGTETLRPSFEFSLDNGTQGTATADVQWTVGAGTSRAIMSVGSARMINLGNLGSTGYAALTGKALASLPYSSISINGNNDLSNVLVPGDVFGVETNAGNFAKVLVTGYVTDPGSSSLQDIQFQFLTYGRAFPHLVVGPLGTDVWTTAIILNNPTANPAAFSMNFLQDTGQPLPLAGGIYNETQLASVQQTGNGQSVSGTIQPQGSVTLLLSSGSFLQGWATLAGAGITGQAVFHRHTVTGADYEATVPLTTGGTEYQVPFDATSYYNGTAQVASLPYITGMALANLDPSNLATIRCSIFGADGRSMGSATPVVLPPLGHAALQLNALSGFGNVIGNIGALDCTSSTSFAVLGLRFLGSNDLTSFAATVVQ